jgi:anion transporter
VSSAAAGQVTAKRPLALVLAALVFAALLLLPPLPGLSQRGQAALAVLLAAVILWTAEPLPTGATALLVVVLLPLSGATPDLPSSLSGFARPTVFFLVGVLALGVATLRSGLADRAAGLFVSAARGRGEWLYWQMVSGFALLALLLPSASTRGAILLPVYEQALERLGSRRHGPVYAATMLGLTSLNRLGSNALLTGGITPVVASALMGGFTWTSWLLYMGVPVYTLLFIGGCLVYLLTRPDRERLPGASELSETEPAAARRGPLTPREWRALLITGAVSCLWATDGLHHWDPAIPALLGATALLLPSIGVLTWRELETGVGWANVLVVGASLCLGGALQSSGAASWLADWLRLVVAPFTSSATATAAALIVACLLLRALLANISAYLTLLIPVALELAPDLGLNGLVCAMLVTIAGDSVLYFPAQSSSSLLVTERGHLSPWPVLRIGLLMAGAALVVLLLLAIPYWETLGQPLAIR